MFMFYLTQEGELTDAFAAIDAAQAGMSFDTEID
jgi:hypothetical protein